MTDSPHLEAARALCDSVKELLTWMPICSKGSSGYLYRQDVEKALSAFGEDGSLKYVVGVEADLKHLGNHTGGEIAEALTFRSGFEAAQPIPAAPVAEPDEKEKQCDTQENAYAGAAVTGGKAFRALANMGLLRPAWTAEAQTDSDSDYPAGEQAGAEPDALTDCLPSKKGLDYVAAQAWSTSPYALLEFVRRCFGLSPEGTPPYYHLHKALSALANRSAGTPVMKSMPNSFICRHGQFEQPCKDCQGYATNANNQ